MSDITQIEVGGTTYDIVDDKAQIENLSLVECSTARSTAAKVVTLNGFTLKTGARILVRFTNTGTSNPSSGNLTLNVNGTGAKTIVDGHTNKTVMTYSNAGYFYNNYVAEFVYDGTYWVYLNRDNNTTYNGSSLKTNGTITGSGTAIADTILANTTMDTALGTLLNNDAALENNKAETLFVANKADIANLNLGNATTNITGSTITKGKYFYLNDNLVRAIVDIANGATFTLDTNYEYVTVGDELVSLKASLNNVIQHGTDGIFTYQKFNDGTYKAWYYGESRLIGATAMASGLYHHTSASSFAPPTFSKSVTKFEFIEQDAILGWFAGFNNSNNAYTAYIVNANNSNNYQVNVRIIFEGTW